MKTSLKTIFYLLIISAFFALGQMFVRIIKSPVFFFLSLGAFFLLGAALIVSTFREKITGNLKKFLLLTGFSAAGFPVFALLHNMVYALFMVLFGQDFWTRTGLGDEPVFFILAAIVCPIGFIIGAIGTFINLRKTKNDAAETNI